MRGANSRRGTYSRACASLALETAERWIDWVVDDVNSVAEEDCIMGPGPFTTEQLLFLNAAAVDLRQYGPKYPPWESVRGRRRFRKNREAEEKWLNELERLPADGLFIPKAA